MTDEEPEHDEGTSTPTESWWSAFVSSDVPELAVSEVGNTTEQIASQ